MPGQNFSKIITNWIYKFRNSFVSLLWIIKDTSRITFQTSFRCLNRLNWINWSWWIRFQFHGSRDSVLVIVLISIPVSVDSANFLGWKTKSSRVIWSSKHSVIISPSIDEISWFEMFWLNRAHSQHHLACAFVVCARMQSDLVGIQRNRLYWPCSKTFHMLMIWSTVTEVLFVAFFT